MTRVLAGALAFVLFGCAPPEPGEDAGPDPLPPPFAEISVDGLAFVAPEASASITLPQGDGPIIFSVFLVETESPITCGAATNFSAALTLRFELPDGALPGPGEYEVDLGEAAGPAVVVNGIGCEAGAGIRTTGGTVTLSRADDALIEGELAVTTEEGTATGTFRAHVCDDEGTFQCG